MQVFELGFRGAVLGRGGVGRGFGVLLGGWMLGFKWLFAGVGERVEDHELIDFERVGGVGCACCYAEVVILGHLDLRIH